MDNTLLTTTTQAIVAGERLHLHPHAALYWERAETLVVADLHLGKATHFRRHGMPVPAYVQDETLEKLSGLLIDFRPRRLLMLGDLFHSDYNEEWEDFGDLVLGFHGQTEFALVPGNHDRLTHHQFDKLGITVHPEPYYEGPFVWSHHPFSAKQLAGAESALPADGAAGRSAAAGHYNVAGHLHPAVKLRGSGGTLKLPCFFFGREGGLLPAFGAFTGSATLKPRRGDRAFVIANDSVLLVQ